jgi:hypothetical protein
MITRGAAAGVGVAAADVAAGGAALGVHAATTITTAAISIFHIDVTLSLAPSLRHREH